MDQITIYFDGGARPTNPGNKYGSFEVQLEGRTVFKASRIELGYGTSNEAEYDTLNSALKWTHENLMVAGLPMIKYSATVYTDSTVVHGRISSRSTKGKGEAAARMIALSKQCLARLAYFGHWQIVWQGRQGNVDRFGH